MSLLLRSALCSALWFALAQPALASPAAWREVRGVAAGDAALAFDPATGRLAVGDARGLVVGVPGGAFARVPLHGPVRDVAFAAPEGATLLAASDAGLFRIAPDGGVRRIAPAPGAAARDVRRIAVQAGSSAVATADGVYVSARDGAWQRASLRWPSAPAVAVALREARGLLECWGVLEGRIFTATLAPDHGRLREVSAVPLVLPDAPAGETAVDVVFDVGGADVVVLYATALAVRDAQAGTWRTLRPTLAPGASFARLVAAREQLWLATDRGLWAAGSLAGPWRRASATLASRPVRAIAGAGRRLFIATDAGVRELAAAPLASRGLRGATDSAARGARGATGPGARRVQVATDLRANEGEPSITLVQRTALAHLDLGPTRLRSMWRGVGRRGWLPLVALRVGAGAARDRDVDFDDAFLSGETRHLVDRSRGEGRDFDALLTLSWDLGDVAYHPEAIDVSREAREVLKLRDDVLDEVNQLYFERLRVLAQLSFGADTLAPEERLRLRLRAAELAAGLDAWTGGWFQRAAAGARP